MSCMPCMHLHCHACLVCSTCMHDACLVWCRSCMHVFHNRTYTYRCQHYGCHAFSCFHAWLVTVWRQDKLSTSVYLVLHPHPYQNTFSGIYRSGIHACEAGASKIHDFLLHMQLGPWCKQRPLPSFAVSTKSSNPFLKHACIFSNKLERYKHIPFINYDEALWCFGNFGCKPKLHVVLSTPPSGLWKAHLYGEKSWLIAILPRCIYML